MALRALTWLRCYGKRPTHPLLPSQRSQDVAPPRPPRALALLADLDATPGLSLSTGTGKGLWNSLDPKRPGPGRHHPHMGPLGQEPPQIESSSF